MRSREENMTSWAVPCLKRKPYPMPKRRGVLFKLEGFKYAIALDLYMDIITYVLEKRPATYVLLSYHGESTGTNAYHWGLVTPRDISSRK